MCVFCDHLKALVLWYRGSVVVVHSYAVTLWCPNLISIVLCMRRSMTCFLWSSFFSFFLGDGELLTSQVSYSYYQRHVKKRLRCVMWQHSRRQHWLSALWQSQLTPQRVTESWRLCHFLVYFFWLKFSFSYIVLYILTHSLASLAAGLSVCLSACVVSWLMNWLPVCYLPVYLCICLALTGNLTAKSIVFVPVCLSCIMFCKCGSSGAWKQEWKRID